MAAEMLIKVFTLKSVLAMEKAVRGWLNPLAFSWRQTVLCKEDAPWGKCLALLCRVFSCGPHFLPSKG